ncbi:HRD3 [Candida pseudojiufengensis]|uniref:HRD3 n=1 Tax=Candida pseudojiufengensis TaxID=497109 RepID=UPI002224FAA8|nr:HRD3 [Candida pseudojiufengensis]KAI5962952.1 HRD3 [Candida pseudojiufengensis]
MLFKWSNIALLFTLQIYLVFGFKDVEYIDAIEKLDQLSKTYKRSYIYNADNIENNLIIPPYNSTNKQYNQELTNEVPFELTDVILPMLERSSSKNNSNACITLADLYLFGNYSFPTDYELAKSYYEKAISIEPNGHAYFMLGFIYSTGLFGEFPVNQAKANLYYHFAAENGDINALLVLAFRHLKGIEVPLNCELALPYYSKLAELGHHWMNNTQNSRDVDYNIRISDFNGGLFGEKLSESVSSIEISSKLFADLKTQFEENRLNSNEHEYASFYYNGLENLKGDYFTPRNLTRARLEFQKCVNLGEEIYGSRDYKNMDKMDRLFLSACQTSLARLYLRGQSVSKDSIMAERLLNMSMKVQTTSEALNDLAYIQENGLVRPANRSKALEYYLAAAQKSSAEGTKNLAKLLMKIDAPVDIHISENKMDIYSYMKQAAYLGNTEALYYVGNFLESGLASMVDPEDPVTCAKTTMYYREFVKRLSQFFTPHLKYAFDELASGNYKNALVGYSIAAEQGFEHAQISAAYLLFQLQPLYSSNKKLKEFSPPRLEIAAQYLDRASKQSNVDATILLGHIYSGEDKKIEITPDHEKAFNYFRVATDRHSSHGAYKLAEMYEYGFGSANNTTDYFLAKRYYDLSLQYKEKFDFDRKSSQTKSAYSNAHINWALFRLRLKYLFNKKSFLSSFDEPVDQGWLSSFKKIGKESKREKQQQQLQQQQQQLHKDSVSRADSHHQGTSYDLNYIENYDIGDYLVISLTFAFFLIFFIQNILRQIRRMRNGEARQGQHENENNNGNNNNNNNALRNGWNINWNGFQFDIRGGNMEFHFFAL